MKKFLKWSAAFLVLGVLAVGCVKNEPSNGIEAMRNAKASLLSAQAELEKAKAQVEIAQAAFIQAQASYLKATEAIVAAQAAAIEAETAWQKALTEFHKEGWEIKIKELEENLRIKKAQADAAIASWELEMAKIQTALIAEQELYEQALWALEEWKLANIDTLAGKLIAALDNLTIRIKAVITALAEERINLNKANALYLQYVQSTYPAQISELRQTLEFEKRGLICEVEYLEGVVEAYDALYNSYHGELDDMIAGYQNMINAYRETIAQMEISYIELKEELDWVGRDLDYAEGVLNEDRTVTIRGVFSDGGSDPAIHVTNGTYSITDAWYLEVSPWVYTPLFTRMNADIATIERTRLEFQDQESGQIEAIRKAKQDAAKKAKEDYEGNWDKWQEYYEKASIPTGSLYVAWQDAWGAWKAKMTNYDAHLKTYGDMYEEAEKLLKKFMKYMDEGIIVEDDGSVVVPGTITISEVLGGIKFNATTLAQFVFGGNTQAFVDVVKNIIALINLPGEIDAIVTDLKGLMDGTHDKGYPPFWEHAGNWTFNPKSPVFGDVMRNVYKGQERDITQITKQDWYVWLFLYWLFEERTVELGLDDPNGGPVITINPGAYDNAAQKVLEDFFGKYNRSGYAGIMVKENTDKIKTAVKNYYDAVEGLSAMELSMFRPFNRTWSAHIKTGEFNRSQAAADYTKEPALTKIAPNYAKYNLPPEVENKPKDASEFFFVLEAYKDKTGPIPSLAFDITYLDAQCNLWVNYFALLDAGVGDACKDSYSEWQFDMQLWAWEERADYSNNGHYFHAINMERDYKVYEATYNRVVNGEYDALIEKIQAKYDEQWAKYQDALAVYKEIEAEYGGIALNMYIIQYIIIPDYVTFIGQYEQLIAMARKAHNEGIITDGLLFAWNSAKEKLITKRNALDAVIAELEMLDEGYYSETVQDLTDRKQADIDKVLAEIRNLQDQMAVLEALREKLLAEYQF